MVHQTIALFGEAEKGEYRTAYYCHSLPQLVDTFGQPPEKSSGLYYAVQVLLYNRKLIFFRVEEEGFSEDDYYSGLRLLERENLFSRIRQNRTGLNRIRLSYKPLVND